MALATLLCIVITNILFAAALAAGQPVHMQVGDIRRVVIRASEPWNPLGIEVHQGEVYEFRVYGNQRWTDWYRTTDADGYRWGLNSLFAHWKRTRAPWFALTGAFDRNDATAFLIGVRSGPTIQRSGVLYAFANDVRRAYGNNHGSLELTIKRKN